MHKLFLMLSYLMPEDMIIKELEEAIKEYKLNPSSGNKSKVGLFCMIFSSKDCADRTEGGVLELIRKAEQSQKGYDLLNPKKN